jgi:hypothetical protein
MVRRRRLTGALEWSRPSNPRGWMQHRLLRIDLKDGSHETLLTESDGLYNPASITFGRASGDKDSVFFTNFALLPPEPPVSLRPGVLKFDVEGE